MKTVILAGGLGTRLSEFTENLPKPMVQIGGKPILWHIMNRYAGFGNKDFVLALGYKGDMIKDYFINYRTLNSDFSIDLESGNVKTHISSQVDWRVSLVDTGLHTMTGGRLKRLVNHLGNETFFLTYGDGVANINFHELLEFHKSHGKMVTITAVRPNARFGEIQFGSKGTITFDEKPQLHDGWINGGFMVIEPQFLDIIAGDGTMLEREPFEELSRLGELVAFKHTGFWQCMDNKRDHEVLEELWKNNAPWAN